MRESHSRGFVISGCSAARQSHDPVLATRKPDIKVRLFFWGILRLWKMGKGVEILKLKDADFKQCCIYEMICSLCNAFCHEHPYRRIY
jgi:hypothetical protein